MPRMPGRIYGVDYILRRMQTFEKLFHEEVIRGMEIALTVVQNRAIKLCKERIYDTPPSPDYVRTGNLINSIAQTITEMTRDKISGEVFAAVFYAAFVELGTRFKEARPFLYPALVQTMKQVIVILQAAYQRAGFKLGPARVSERAIVVTAR